MQLNVKVYPRASRNAVECNRDGSLKIRVTTAPEDNKANDAVLKLLADRLGIPRTSVRILRGHRTRNKIVQLEGLANEDLVRRLSAGSARQEKD